MQPAQSFMRAGEHLEGDEVREFIGLRQRKTTQDAETEWVRQHVADRMSKSKVRPSTGAAPSSRPATEARDCSRSLGSMGGEALALVVAFVLGAAGFNPVVAFAILGVALFIQWRRNRRSEQAVRIRREVELDQPGLEQLYQGLRVPPWAEWQDVESARWLNSTVAGLWPKLKVPVGEAVVQVLEPLINWYLPTEIKGITFSCCDLGTSPAVVSGVKAVTSTDEIHLDMSLQFVATDEHISVACQLKRLSSPITVLITQLQCEVALRLILRKPTSAALPYFETLAVTLTKEPHLDFGLQAANWLGELTLLSAYLVSTLQECCKWYRYPKEHRIAMAAPNQTQPEVGWSDPISGVMVVKVIEARHLRNCTKHDKIYAKICTGLTAADQQFTTGMAVGPDYRFPGQDNAAELNIKDLTQQRILITIKRDCLFSDQTTGKLEIEPALGSVGKPWRAHRWQSILGSDGTVTGKLHLELEWQTVQPQQPLADGSHGVLTVHVKEGVNLVPRDASGLSDPYVVVSMGKRGDEREQQTHICRKTLNPTWQSHFRFVVRNAQLQGLYLSCWDDDSVGRDFMGSAVAKVGEAIHAGAVEKEYALQDVESGVLMVRLEWNEIGAAPPSVGSTYQLCGPDAVLFRYTADFYDRVPEERALPGSMIVSTGREEIDQATGVSLVELEATGYWLPLTDLKGHRLVNEASNMQVLDHTTLSATELQAVRRTQPESLARTSSSIGSGGIMTVFLQQAQKLQHSESQQPYALLSIRSELQRSTASKRNAGDTVVWEELFFFAVEDYHTDTLLVVLLDQADGDRLLGRVEIPILDVVLNSGSIEHKWMLEDVTKGELLMSLYWKNH